MARVISPTKKKGTKDLLQDSIEHDILIVQGKGKVEKT